MGVQELIDAFRDDPGGPIEDDVLAQLVAGGFVIPSDTAVTTGVLQINPRDSVTGAIRDHYFFGDGTFVYAPTDGISAHDGISTLVLIGGYRYHRLGDIRVKAVEAVGIEAEPTPSEYGQAWIDLTGVVGDANQIIIHTSRGWVAQDADYGPPIYVKTGTDGYLAKSFVHWAGDDGWVAGVGAGAYAASTIPLSALIGFGLGPVRVSDQTTFAPPGSRISGGTPTMPLGGTAANINDNSSATTGTTSALGDLTGASLAGRIAARISYATAQDIIAIDALAVKLSTGTATLQVYTSIDNGSNWVAYGSSFACTATEQILRRAAEVSGVTDIALVVEAKNYSTATLSLKWLNAHDDTFTLAKGNRFIVAANAFGILAGKEGQVCSADEADVATFYDPAQGNSVFDIALGYPIEWNGTAWVSALGAFIGYKQTGLSSPGSLTDTGTGSEAYSATTGPTSSVRRIEFDQTLTYAAKNASSRLIFRFTGSLTAADGAGVVSGSGNSIIVFILRDAESASIAWQKWRSSISTFDGAVCFELDLAQAGDTNSHDYKLAFTVQPNVSNRVLVTAMSRCKFSVTELPPQS